MRSSSSSSPSDVPASAPSLTTDIDVSAVIRRMKKEYDVTSDADLAASLGVAKTTVSSWRKRNSIPLEICVRAAYDNRSSIDYIISGRDRNDLFPGLYESDIDIEIMIMCVYDQILNERGDSIKDTFKRAGMKARTMITEYERYRELMREAMKRSDISRPSFIASLKTTIEGSQRMRAEE